MRRLVAWIAGLVGIAALARGLARRRARPAPALESPVAEPDPADELRRKLTETREAAETTGAFDAAAEPTETLAERRSRVHAKAQEAIQAMQDPPA